MFHIDCTYKIVKYGYPLIVFGTTDLKRKFYPIAYMLTSHEQQKDFDYFWIQLFNVCKTLKINVNLITFICTDADYAMANSLQVNLPESKLIMCYYHLRANVIFLIIIYCF